MACLMLIVIVVSLGPFDLLVCIFFSFFFLWGFISWRPDKQYFKGVLLAAADAADSYPPLGSLTLFFLMFPFSL